MGKKLLRATLLSPSQHQPTINARLDLMDILLDDVDGFFATIELLAQIGDLDKILVRGVVRFTIKCKIW